MAEYKICIHPSEVPQRVIVQNGSTYYFTHRDVNGNYCYGIYGGGPRRRKRRQPQPPSATRICTGEISFAAQNFCNLINPEPIDVSFALSPFGELFNDSTTCVGVPVHDYARFFCNQDTNSIEATLLAQLKSQFVGKVTFDVTTSTIGSGFDNFVTEILILPDGKIVVGGQFLSYNGVSSNRIIILNPDFSVFAVAQGTGFDNAVVSILLAPDGSGDLLVGGNFTDYNGTPSVGIVRLNSDLTLDTAQFGTGFDAPAVQDLTLLPNGDLVVGGGFLSYNGTPAQKIIILNSNDFSIIQSSEGTGFNSVVNTLATLNGNIVAGGSFTDYNGVTSRSIIILDTTLASGTAITPSGLGFNSGLLSVEINSLGQIVVGGIFDTYNGIASSRIIVLDGSLNIVATAAGTGFLGGGGSVQEIVIQPNGDILAGGTFTDYNGTSSEGIIRLSSDLTTVITPALGTGFGAFPNIFAIALQSDGKIVAGGFFSDYNGTPANHIIRLNADFTPDVSALDTFTIEVTFTDNASNPAPTSLLGTVLEDCNVIANDIDMNLQCVIQ